MAKTPITAMRLDEETKIRLQMLANQREESMTGVVKTLVHEATADMIAVMSVDTRPVRDMMQNIEGVPTWTMLEIDPQERRCWVTQEMKGNSAPSPLWHGRHLSCKIPGHPREDEVEAFLATGEGQEMMQAICAGHSVEWNGNNIVGSLTDEARRAWELLCEALEDEFSDGYHFWEIDDWMMSVEELTAETTDEELSQLAADLEADALAQSVILDADIEEWLTEQREELREEE